MCHSPIGGARVLLWMLDYIKHCLCHLIHLVWVEWLVGFRHDAVRWCRGTAARVMGHKEGYTSLLHVDNLPPPPPPPNTIQVDDPED